MEEQGQTPAPAPRRAGRPSIVARYAASIAEWLDAEPGLSSAEILRRVQRAGYRGGKSALYDLVKHLRVSGPGRRTVGT